MQTDIVLELRYTDAETGKPGKIKPQHRVPSFDLLEDLQLVNDRYKSESVDRIAAADLPEDIKKLEQISHIRENVSSTKSAIALQTENDMAERRRRIECARMIVDVDRLQPAERELVASDIDSEFWRSQNQRALGAWVDGFCKDNGVR